MNNKEQNERMASSDALRKMSDDYMRDNKCLMCNISFPFFEAIDSPHRTCTGVIVDNNDALDGCKCCFECCPYSKQCGCGVYYDTHEDEDKDKCRDNCDQLPRACCGVVTKNLYEMCDDCKEECGEE